MEEVADGIEKDSHAAEVVSLMAEIPSVERRVARVQVPELLPHPSSNVQRGGQSCRISEPVASEVAFVGSSSDAQDDVLAVPSGLVEDRANDIERELLLMKVRVPSGPECNLPELIEAADARVLDDCPETFTLELTCANDQVDEFIQKVGACSEILAVVRSGAMAIARGHNVLSTGF